MSMAAMIPVRGMRGVMRLAAARSGRPSTGGTKFGSPPPVKPLTTDDAQTNRCCARGSYELGGQFAPPQMPGFTIVGSSPTNGVKMRPSLTSANPSGAMSTCCGTTASPRGNGCVAAVACRGSCGTARSSMPTIGSPVSRSRMYAQPVLPTSTIALRARPSDVQVHEHDGVARVVVPDVVMHLLEVPAVFAGLRARSRRSTPSTGCRRRARRRCSRGPHCPSRSRRARAPGRSPASAKRTRRRTSTRRCPAATSRGPARRGPESCRTSRAAGRRLRRTL